jgi:hypothetical protein
MLFHNSSSKNVSNSGKIVNPEDGGSMDLRNVSILPQHYTALQVRRPRLDRWENCIAAEGEYFEGDPSQACLQ